MELSHKVGRELGAHFSKNIFCYHAGGSELCLMVAVLSPYSKS